MGQESGYLSDQWLPQVALLGKKLNPKNGEGEGGLPFFYWWVYWYDYGTHRRRSGAGSWWRNEAPTESINSSTSSTVSTPCARTSCAKPMTRRFTPLLAPTRTSAWMRYGNVAAGASWKRGPGRDQPASATSMRPVTKVAGFSIINIVHGAHLLRLLCESTSDMVMIISKNPSSRCHLIEMYVLRVRYLGS